MPVNDYLVGQLIQDLKTLTSQLEYYQKMQHKRGQAIDTPIFKDLEEKAEETITEIKGAIK